MPLVWELKVLEEAIPLMGKLRHYLLTADNDFSTTDFSDNDSPGKGSSGNNFSLASIFISDLVLISTLVEAA